MVVRTTVNEDEEIHMSRSSVVKSHASRAKVGALVVGLSLVLGVSAPLAASAATTHKVYGPFTSLSGCTAARGAVGGMIAGSGTAATIGACTPVDTGWQFVVRYIF